MTLKNFLLGICNGKRNHYFITGCRSIPKENIEIPQALSENILAIDNPSKWSSGNTLCFFSQTTEVQYYIWADQKHNPSFGVTHCSEEPFIRANSNRGERNKTVEGYSSVFFYQFITKFRTLIRLSVSAVHNQKVRVRSILRLGLSNILCGFPLEERLRILSHHSKFAHI